MGADTDRTLEWLDLSGFGGGQQDYNLSPAQHQLINQCMWELLSNPDGNRAIDLALAQIGQALGVSRAYVFLQEADGVFSNTHEWCAEGVTPEKENLRQIPILQLSPGWTRALMRDGLLVASDIRDLEPAAYAALAPQGIKAVAEFPIRQEQSLRGFVGFDDCIRHRVWTREEVRMLHTLTGIITATLRKLELERKLREEGRRLESMLNAMDTMIYVSDLKTQRILFANDTLQAMYDRPLTGEICWEALQGRTARCPFCPLPHLLANPGQSYQWEFYNEVLGGHFRIRDSIIPWAGGEMAHFEYAENITELKKYHQHLEQSASTDMLTGALNRTSFEAYARNGVERALRDGEAVTVAFVDIDGLKAENDLRGHAAGDQLIRNVVRALRDNVRGSDRIGRYGGDEFVVFFAGCDHPTARARIEKAVAELEALERERGVDASFSYGMACSNELDAATAVDAVLAGMLQLADRRMMARKRDKKRTRGAVDPTH